MRTANRSGRFGLEAQAPASAIAGLRHWRTARFSVIAVDTRGGVTGYGECAAVEQAEVDRAAGLIAGREATAWEMTGRMVEGPVAAAVTMALLDITGKLARAPVYQVLGGPTRHKARAMAAAEGATTAEMRDSIERLRGRGYRVFRVAVTPGDAVERLAALRQAFGDGVEFVLDAGGRWSPAQASRVAAAVERLHPLWLDEPCPLDNLRAVGKVSGESVTPLGFGRSARRPADFQELLREQVIDVLRPDLSRMSIASIRRAAAIAETYYTAVAPYNAGGRIATAAGLHLAASLANFYLLDVPVGAATVVDGFAELPTGAGLGIEIREGEWA